MSREAAQASSNSTYRPAARSASTSASQATTASLLSSRRPSRTIETSSGVDGVAARTRATNSSPVSGRPRPVRRCSSTSSSAMLIASSSGRRFRAASRSSTPGPTYRRRAASTTWSSDLPVRSASRRTASSTSSSSLSTAARFGTSQVCQPGPVDAVRSSTFPSSRAVRLLVDDLALVHGGGPEALQTTSGGRRRSRSALAPFRVRDSPAPPTPRRSASSQPAG